MPAIRIAALALATFALAGAAVAQDQVKLDDFDADRLNSRQMLIEFEYQGGACEELGEAQLGALAEGTLALTMQIVNTAEVCTMQMVEHEIKEAIQAGPEVTRVELTLLAADGQVMVTETTRVDED